MFARITGSIRSAASRGRQRWRAMDPRARAAISAGVAIVIAGAIGAIVVLRPGGLGSTCDKPLCVEVIGPGGDDVPTMASVRIRLGGEVDRHAAMAALRISNEPAGRRQFKGDVLTFTPEWPGFARGVAYDVSLKLDATQVPQGAGPVDVGFHFTTTGKLNVASAFPTNGANEIPLDGAIMVQFNRSVAPLTVITKRGPEGILAFDPPIAGQGRWLNTSLYTFKPSGAGWAPSTVYHVRVKAGLANELGSTLDADYAFSFTTLRPAATVFQPATGSKFVAPQPDVKVTFNQPVDHASAEAAFTLGPQAGGAPIAGTVTWPDALTLVFQPARRIALDTAYVATMTAGVKSPDGAGATERDATSVFTTVGVPRVDSTSPADGEQNANRYGINIHFSNPMDHKSVEDRVAVDPKPSSDPHLNWSPDDTSLQIGVPLAPSSPYRVTLAAGAVDRYGQLLAAPLDVHFVTAKVDPSFHLFRSAQTGTYDAYLDPQVGFSATNLGHVDFKLYGATREGLIFAERGMAPATSPPPAGVLIRSWGEDIANPPLDQPVTLMTRLAAEGQRLPEGTYRLFASAPGTLYSESIPFVISSVNVVTKWTEHDLLVWMVDMQSGAAVSNMPFDVLDNFGNVAASGTTDSDGVARVDLEISNRDYYPGYYVASRTGGPVFLSGTMWNNSIQMPYGGPDSALQVQFSPPELVGYLYTDRPIYRPGEIVYFKGVVRKDDDAHYTLPPSSTPLRLSINDARGREIDNEPVTLSDLGTFEVKLALSSEASTGQYFANLVWGNISPPLPNNFHVTGVSFRVAEFRNPEFEVDLKPSKDSYVNGEKIDVTVTADLFFGAPLANAKVNWTATSQPAFFRPDGFPGYSFDDYTPNYDYGDGPYFEPQQHVRGSGEGVTGPDGTFRFSVPADVSADPLSQTFTLEVGVTDENGQAVGDSKGVVVHKGQFYVGLKPDDYVANAGQDASVSLVTIDRDGKAKGNVATRVSVYSRQWKTVRTREPDGSQHYTSTPQDTFVQAIDVTTDGDGKGNFSFKPGKSGEYYLLAESKDAAGNAIKSSVEIWASSAEYASWRVGNDDIINLVSDKDEYQPGDTARILVPAPFTGSRGLVTQERGRLMSYSLRDFATNSEVIEVPITEDHVPNVIVGVVLFKAPGRGAPLPQMKLCLVNLKVATDVKKLDITITPDRDRYGPRETVHYRIRTTDSTGRGVPAEVSLALVDKSVLSLQEDSARPALDAFWSQRPLGVMSGSSFAVSIDRANELAVRLSSGGKGGGGGAGDQTRTFFPNTAYWNGALRTGNDGDATVDVQLPDTLTTWRLTARGVTADTRAGEARNDVVTSKDVIVRPAVPRFLVAGDNASLGAIVHNFTDSAIKVGVSLKADGITVSGDSTQTVNIDAGADAVVRWQTSVPSGRDKFDVTFSASGGGKSDSVKLTLPLYSFYTPETVGTAGEVTDAASEAIDVPSYVRPDAGELTVKVAPSLTAGADTALRYLQEYPYESVETTVSRFVPLLAVHRAGKELGLKELTDEGSNIDEEALIQRSLQRLYNQQHSDGSWGWWEGDNSDPAVSAWVMVGLGEAKRSGYKVDAAVEASASQYLRGALDQPRDVRSPEFDLRAYILYALAVDGNGDLGRAYALAEQSSQLSNAAKAWVALAIARSGGRADDPRVQALFNQLQGAAIPSATGNHWEEKSYDLNSFGNSTQTTALVLQAYTELQPDNPLVDGTLRWLMIARKEGRWESPHDTATALLAITDFMLVRKDAQASVDYRVELNGDRKLSGHADAGKMGKEDSVVIEMKDLLKDATNELVVKRSPADAAGRLHYTAHLRYFTPAEDVEAANYGVGVSHEYSLASDDAATPVTQAALGDVVRVKVTLIAPADLNFLVLEDFLPAGLEPIDTSLKTTQPEIERKLAEAQGKAYQATKRFSPFGHADLRDNRAALFARFVEKGVYEYTYFARATTPGDFKVPPATAYEQYFPEVWGRSDGGLFHVTDTSVAGPAVPSAPHARAAGWFNAVPVDEAIAEAQSSRRRAGARA